MTLNEYQTQAMTTCMDTCRNIPYMLFNLQGEVGELSSKIAKAIRRGELEFGVLSTDICKPNNTIWNDVDGLIADDMPQDMADALKGELGDVLWQLSGMCSVLGFTLEDVAQYNLNKLASRKQRGVIDGDGDKR